MLNQIQKATGTAVMATEQGSKAVDAGLAQCHNANEAIQTLSDSIDDAAQAAMQIAASSQEQLVGVDQVALAMNSIKEASTQTVVSMKELENAAHSLNDVGNGLKELAAHYHV
jgi:methyl-accepting chemotaxis protein